ncbi:neuroblast differentiation-associated protein AHNAK-like [Salarias fasciatus]|uniref:neuroblast differentiation-associated protein AHNAK-like n=1 Tax=Salarias fasciatus TaxID=181472 RepID=UPI001176FF76|nr:neuroblast differentiation-associated protein AHNAK-like [Salarias fasciatus]
MFEKRSTPKMSKLKEVPSPESGVIVKTAKDGCAEGLVYGGGGRDGIFIKGVVPESPASKSLKLKEGDQILSATVYFDNVSYEDAIQILEHAQAYKMKLCLKRKPDISQTEAPDESDAIPEEDIYAPEMREQGKTKRRGDARISWPKFPSFGKGRKKNFTRSHSSSEADEQRKLELSPTTSDTESPIKSQDALKGKKKNKMKLSVLTKRGRISSSEDQETVTTGQISSDIQQTQESDLLSPECLESPSADGPQVYTGMEDKSAKTKVKGMKESKRHHEETVQMSIDVDSVKEAVSKLPGYKLPKVDTSGMPIPEEITTDMEEKDISLPDVKMKMPDTEVKLKGPEFDLGLSKGKVDVKIPESQVKLPEVDPGKIDVSLSNATIEVKKPDMETRPLETEGQQGGKFKMPNFDIKMPKIKGPEIDLSLSRKDAGVKTPQIDLTVGKVEVEEQDSKLKMPKFGVSMPKVKGPEIHLGLSNKDAEVTAPEVKADVELKAPSAKIEMKAPQVDVAADNTVRSSTQFTMPNISFSIPKVTGPDIHFGLPKKDADVKLPAVKAEVKLPEAPETDVKLGSVDVSLPEAKMKLEKPELEIKPPEIEDVDVTLPEVKGEIKLPEVKKPSAEVEIKAPEIKVGTKDTKGSPLKFKMPAFKLPKFGVGVPAPDVDVKIPEEILTSLDVKMTGIKVEGKESKFKVPKFGISLPKVQGPEIDFNLSQRDAKLPEGEVDINLPKAPGMDIDLGKVDVSIPEAEFELKQPELEMKPLEIEGEVEGRKFKLPKFGIKMPEIKGPKFDLSMSKKEVTLPEAEVKLPEAPEVDVKLGSVDVSLPEAKMKLEKPELEIKPLKTEVELGGQGTKFKMPKLGVTMPKMKGPDVDLNLSKKDIEVTLPEAEM